MKKCSQNSLARYFDVVEKNKELLGKKNKQQNQKRGQRSQNQNFTTTQEKAFHVELQMDYV